MDYSKVLKQQLGKGYLRHNNRAKVCGQCRKNQFVGKKSWELKK